jgi:hypothetical protein
MAYIGNSPEKGNFRKADSITCSATATYNLLVGGVAVNPNQNQCIVSLNGVVQSSGNSYTIASSQITFSQALTSSDVIDFILILGDTLDAGVPSDDTVGLAQLSATGSPSSSNFLRGDNSWTDPGGVSLATSTNNQVATVTGANALAGEADLQFTGQTLTVGTTNNGIITSGYELQLASPSGEGITFDTNGLGTEAMRITSAQKVGIGETSPLGKLHIKTADSGADVNSNFDELVIEGSGDGGMTILSGTSNTGGIMFGDSGDNDIGKIEYTHTDNIMKFGTSGTEKMRIASGGQVIITDNNFSGTPLGDDTAAQNGRLHVKGTSGNEIAVFQTASNGRQIQFYNAGATYVGGIAINSGDTTYATSSDYRLKENETSITDGIDRIKQLKPYRFNFKTDTDKTVDGFFAHEVSSIVPEAITGTKDAMHPEVLYTDAVLYTAEDELPEGMSIGDVKIPADELPEGKNFGDVKEATKINPQGIDQSKLVPLLTSALQEAITKIETLEAKVTALENK